MRRPAEATGRNAKKMPLVWLAETAVQLGGALANGGVIWSSGLRATSKPRISWPSSRGSTRCSSLRSRSAVADVVVTALLFRKRCRSGRRQSECAQVMHPMLRNTDQDPEDSGGRSFSWDENRSQDLHRTSAGPGEGHQEAGSGPLGTSQTARIPLGTRVLDGAGDENRTRVVSLEDWGSTIELRPRTAPAVVTAGPARR